MEQRKIVLIITAVIAILIVGTLVAESTNEDIRKDKPVRICLEEAAKNHCEKEGGELDYFIYRSTAPTRHFGCIINREKIKQLLFTPSEILHCQKLRLGDSE